jgi:hypothetical protein
MTLYISGPMTGLPNYNRAAFDRAEDTLVARGHNVWSPARLPPGHDWEWYMTQCLAALPTCDGVALLPGWRYSRGANIEVAAAHNMGMPVLPVCEWPARF